MIRACVICLKQFGSEFGLPGRILEVESIGGGLVTCSPACSDALKARIEAEKQYNTRSDSDGREFYTEKDEDHSGETEAERARKVFDQAKKVLDVDAIAGVKSKPEDLVVGIASPGARIAVVQAVQRILEAAELLEHSDLPQGLAATAGLLAARLLVEAYGEDIPDYG